MTRYHAAPLALSLMLGLLHNPARASAVPTFEKDVLPLLKANCFPCHGTDTPKAGLDLRTRATLLKGGKSGPGVVPGSLKDSHLWLNVSTDKMPATGDRLSDEQKDMLRAWILAGAPGDGVAATQTAGTTRTAAPTKPAVKLGVQEVARRIDAAIDQRLKEAKVPASPQADDAEFLRRVYLDITGRIPPAEKTIAFLASPDPEKRTKLVDELLAAPEYGQYHAGTWARLITAEEPALKPGLEKWLATAFNEGRGWDAIVRGLLTATGQGPETAFVMSNVENKMPQPEKLTGATARLFLGVQLQCAECHNHPFTEWKQVDFWGLAAFFSRTRTQAKGPPAGVAEAETPLAKGKAVPAGAAIVISMNAGKGAGKVVKAKFPQGAEPSLPDAGPFRPALADWLTAPENPYFAPAAVNRLWGHFFGRGLVNPVDDLHDGNPPTHPGALQTLADEFRVSGHDLKHLIRCLCATQAYQRTSKALAENRDDESLYSRMALKVMGPEAMYDSLLVALGTTSLNVKAGPPTGTGRGGVRKPTGKEAGRENFLRLFNTRDPDATPADFTHGIPQALSLMNDPAFTQDAPVLGRLVKADPQPEKVIEGLYLAVLSRRPSAEELKQLTAYVGRQPDPVKGYAGVLWLLVNSQEFVLIR